MTIKARIIVACGLLLLLNAGLGLFARNQQHRMGERAMAIYDESYIGLTYITAVQTGLVRLEADDADPALRPSIEKSVGDLQTVMSNLEVAIERAMTARARAQGQALLAQFQRLTKETSTIRFVSGLEAVSRDLTALVRRFGADGLAARDDVEQSIDRGDRLVLFASVSAVIISLGIALALARSILPTLRDAVVAADAIAAGHLDTELPQTGPGEIAHLMQALDHMRLAIIANLQNIAAQREAEAQLRMQVLRQETDEARELQRAAEAASRAKSTFLAMMSHEIRTPMNAVLGLTTTLLDDAMPAEQRQIVLAIHGSGGILMRILNDVLDFSRLDAGRMTFEHIPFSPATLTQETLSVHGPIAVEKGIRLDVTQDIDLPPRLLADANRIGQVLHNLVSNAVKFTKTGGVAVRAECLSRGADQAVVEWTVTDTGIGMTSAQMTGLFDPFVQADTSITRRFGGSGLGLAICKQLVDGMGGTIAASSIPGTGTIFRVQLPLQTIAESPRVFESETIESITARFARDRPLHVLLAEDNRTNQLVFTRMVRLAGLDVDIANNGAEAVKAAAETKYDIIFMDMSMPEMDGLEATQVIRKGTGPCRHTPIIAMTANAFPEDIQACRDAGMNDFVSKPINRRILVEAISRASQPGERDAAWWGPGSAVVSPAEHPASV